MSAIRLAETPQTAATNCGQRTSWEDWLSDLPTVTTNNDGSRQFWSVPEPALDLRADMELGMNLAQETLRLLRKRQVSSGILSRILEQAPCDCAIAKGFRLTLEHELLVG